MSEPSTRTILPKMSQILQNSKHIAITFIKIGTFSAKAGPFVLVFMLLIILIGSTAPVLELWLLGRIVDQLSILVPHSVSDSFWEIMNILTPVIPWIGFFILIRLMNSLSIYFGDWNRQLLEEKLTYYLGTRILDKAGNVALKSYEHPEFQNELKRATGGLGLGLTNLLYALIEVLKNIITTIGLIVLTYQAHWVIPVVVLTAGIPLLILQNKYNVNQYRLIHGQTSKHRMRNYLATLLSNRDAAKEVRLFGVGPYLTNKWENIYHKLRRQVLSQAIHQRIRLGIVGSLQALTFGASLLLLIYGLSTGQVSIGEAAVIFFAIIHLQDIWKWTINYFGHIHSDYISFTRDFIRFLERPDHELPANVTASTHLTAATTTNRKHFTAATAADGEQLAAETTDPDAVSSSLDSINKQTAMPSKKEFIKKVRQDRTQAASNQNKCNAQPEDNAQQQEMRRSPIGNEVEIEIVGMSFVYPNTTKQVLTDVTVTIRPGEKIAIVGENGAGKSTLAKLLLGLYEPTKGDIRINRTSHINGTSLSAIPDKEWWNQSSAVFQDFAKYHLTLRENIGFGQIEQLDHSQQIATAAEMGGASSIARASGDGYDMMLGPTFGGVDLSGGQWQKVAISRGFMRQAPFIVLDEPNAALDAQAEKDVYMHFQHMAADRTALLISHRIGFARLADRILVLKDGRIIENGTHTELKQLDGEYASLLAMQAEWYTT